MPRTWFVMLLGAAATVATQASMAVAAPAVRGVDTSRLMGSPDPLPPLEAERAFPKLRFDEPLQLAHAGDGSGRVFVCTRKGAIYVFPNRAEAGEADRKLFLDLRGVVATQGQEEGLMSIAFHPQYRRNGIFFVYYTIRPLASVISRFRVSSDPDRAVRESEEVILTFPQPYANHNGGSMLFGPDGYLYIGLGDGGAGGDPHRNGQKMSTLLGKVLRIDVDRRNPGMKYAIPRDNPFAKAGGDTRGEIWALGVRNIWRLGFDRATGRLWAGDVGQNVWEEIDIIERGGNYGWHLREGRHVYSNEPIPPGTKLIEPIWEYHHGIGKSITGGLVYRGKALPEIEGQYVYADFVTGRIWALDYDFKGKRVVKNYELVPPRQVPISSFGEDEPGELYFTAFDGYVYRFRRPERPVASDPSVFPHRLSQTGLFRDLATLDPIDGAVSYDVNVPLWSDYATKARFVVVPAARSVVFHEKQQWEFPVGSVLVKTFFLDLKRGNASTRRRLETRLMVHSQRGWTGYTYVWNDAQTDAELIGDSQTKDFVVQTADGPRKQTWYFPSRFDCDACHTRAAGHVLGLNTRQLNRTTEVAGHSANQLTRLAEAGLFEADLPKSPDKLERFPDWTSPNASADLLARAYLDVNCAVCHRQGGNSGTTIDLRHDTPLAQTNAVGQKPTRGRLGPGDSRVLAPGMPQKSEMYLRASMRGGMQMPNLATSLVDPLALERLASWIKSIPADGVPVPPSRSRR